MNVWWSAPSRLGSVLLRADGDALCALRFDDGLVGAAGVVSEAVDAGAPDIVREALSQLDEYLRGRRRVFTLPLRAAGCGFAPRVWQALQGIDYGRRTSYGALAVQLGLGAVHARAVARAVGANPLLVVVPCHRVVGGDGALRGYAGGVERKRALLELEAAADASPRPTPY